MWYLPKVKTTNQTQTEEKEGSNIVNSRHQRNRNEKDTLKNKENQWNQKACKN
jgi:hypothetical protein